jgi:hypothetical protein
MEAGGMVVAQVKPKRVRLSAEVWKLARFNVEADATSDTKPPSEGERAEGTFGRGASYVIRETHSAAQS